MDARNRLYVLRIVTLKTSNTGNR